MRYLAGYVFDAYDDVDGQVLMTLIPSPDAIPDFVKTASRLTMDDVQNLPDDRFALVLLDNGNKMKKFATVDKGNTALSVMYLLKQAHLLPAKAVKVAAANLIGACRQFGLDVPYQLKMAAETGVSPVSKSLSPSAMLLGHYDAGTADVDQRTNMNSTPDLTPAEIPAVNMYREKTAAADAATQALLSVDAGTRQQSWRQAPYVDVSSWDPSMAETLDNKPPELTLLDGQYAVDGYDQVKTASVYFADNWREFEPRKRHEYCVGLVAHMEKLGMPISEDVARYGSETYSADVDSYVEARRSYVHEEFHPALDTLLEKRAQVSPGTFAEALCEFDNLSSIRWNWDAQVADPWYSTFGPSMDKLAEAEWSFNEDGISCTLEQLKELALNGQTELTKQFGSSFGPEFAKSPKTVFNSMPMPNKKVIARMAAQADEGM